MVLINSEKRSKDIKRSLRFLLADKKSIEEIVKGIRS